VVGENLERESFNSGEDLPFTSVPGDIGCSLKMLVKKYEVKVHLV
jgi:hypothetical protein